MNKITTAITEIKTTVSMENAIRPMCVGRRNWLFSASVKGSEASAMMYSVVATACANGMKVEEYLTALFRSLPGTLIMPW